ncbi:MAG: hypothetical protein IPQ07_33665 [Myxococcales bacterium]|nr:hypothetical protein [Myxococcales bacterium]
MRKIALFLMLTMVAATLAGCFVRARNRPCRTDCWWEHGRRVCDKRCR